MTVGKLKEILAKMPDHFQVCARNMNGYDIWFLSSVDVEKGFEKHSIEDADTYSDTVETLPDVFDAVVLE